MSDMLVCPRCGSENPTGAMNCARCRINLEFAREHPAEIQRMKQVVLQLAVLN
jgi:transposase-like protein